MTPSVGDLGALHSILAIPILAFIPFLLLKCQKSDASPFDDQNTTIFIFIFYVATLTYVAAMVAEFKLRIRDVKCPIIVSNISLLCSSLAFISLAMIIFPYLGWFLLATWIVFFVKLLVIDTYHELFKLFQGIAQHASNIVGRKDEQGEENQDPSITITSSHDSPV